MAATRRFGHNLLDMATPLLPTACSSCAIRIEEGQRVCHACGTVRPEVMATAEEEVAALAEARLALHSALSDAELQQQPPGPVRDRFLRHAPLPRQTEALLDEAAFCQSFFSDAFEAETTVPRERFKALLTRLEMNAVDEPELAPKLEVLRARLLEHEATASRNNRNVVLLVLGVVGAVGGVCWLLLRALGQLFGWGR